MGVFNRIRTIAIKAESTDRQRPANIADYCLGQYDIYPEVISESALTDESKAEAARWLSTKRNTCERIHGCAMPFWYMTAYAVEYYEADEDGEFVCGSDYDTADDEGDKL